MWLRAPRAGRHDGWRESHAGEERCDNEQQRKGEGVSEEGVPGQLREAGEKHATPQERRPLRWVGVLHAQLRRGHGGLDPARKGKIKHWWHRGRTPYSTGRSVQ